MNDEKPNHDAKPGKGLADIFEVCLTHMKDLCVEGKEVAMVSFGIESVQVMARALVSEMKTRGHGPDVERWKKEAKESLSPEHYLIWEQQVLPYRLLAWQEVNETGTSTDPNEPKTDF